MQWCNISVVVVENFVQKNYASYMCKLNAISVFISRIIITENEKACKVK
jgi:hypothetical protein